MKPYGVLFVCTGNICRSPTAEAVFRHRIRERGLEELFRHDSAGTHAYHVGNPPDARSAAAARGRGILMDDLRARKVEMDDFEAFDLMLAMDGGHFDVLNRMKPPGGSAGIELFLDYAPRSGLRDVPDPYYGAGDGFETVLDLIEEGVDGLLERLTRR